MECFNEISYSKQICFYFLVCLIPPCNIFFRLWRRCGEGCSSGSALPQDCECPPGQAEDHQVDHIPGAGNVSRGGSLPNPLNLPASANSAGGRASMSSQVLEVFVHCSLKTTVSTSPCR